ncbi:hypothetical protein [Halalkalibacterium ligniniphilum]|uniref:hypothetical protein n=1 Tax=Halalkalibacterium ligniniphilum TaxID=1134413 RepID=UPI000348656B|nr:hypothetical protein [Halalkalibacterium ligniniphilum]
MTLKNIPIRPVIKSGGKASLLFMIKLYDRVREGGVWEVRKTKASADLPSLVKGIGQFLGVLFLTGYRQGSDAEKHPDPPCHKERWKSKLAFHD